MADPIRVMTMTEPVTEAISDDELAYHTKAVFELRVAQGIWQHWSEHLAEKYGLVPGDQIKRDGTISRVGPEGGA